MRAMALLRRPMLLTVVVVAVLAAAMLATYALGADAVSLVLGGALAAGAFAVVVAGWLRPQRRERRRQRRLDQRDARRRARRTRVAIHAAERRLFAQLEAMAWLRDELDLAAPLPPTRGAAAAPDALLELVRLIDRLEASSVVELGSGVSTLVLARRLQQRGAGRVVSLEHLPEYAAATRRELEAQGLAAFATVVDAPLVEHTIGGEVWPWYELGPEVPERIDLLFIDGPPQGVREQARYPALPLLRERLSPGGVALLDDGGRPDERAMVRRWADEVDGVEVAELPLAKGAWRLTMPVAEPSS
jgi:predicted O-methyltransferase YrrM